MKMIDKIKAEIEDVVNSGDGEYGCMEAFELCLKWAEELEQELKEKATHTPTETQQGVALLSKDKWVTIKEIENAFHGGADE